MPLQRVQVHNALGDQGVQFTHRLQLFHSPIYYVRQTKKQTKKNVLCYLQIQTFSLLRRFILVVSFFFLLLVYFFLIDIQVTDL